jgi:hypothetical protein
MNMTDGILRIAHNHDGQSILRTRPVPAALESEEHVVPIRQFLKEGVFDPDVIAIMSTAFEDVCKALELSGRRDVTREMVATKVIHLVRGVETDPVVLRDKVLGEFGLPQAPKEP